MKVKVTVVHKIDGTIKVDRFTGRKVTCQTFKGGRGIVLVDRCQYLYRNVQKITRKERS